jgi:hypothetical protein
MPRNKTKTYWMFELEVYCFMWHITYQNFGHVWNYDIFLNFKNYF